jgi:hypothetical protein
LQKRVAEKQADRLRLLIVVGACRRFVAAFRNRLQIILAHLYPQFAEPAALALAQRPPQIDRRNIDGAAGPFPRPAGPWQTAQCCANFRDPNAALGSTSAPGGQVMSAYSASYGLVETVVMKLTKSLTRWQSVTQPSAHALRR